MRLNLATPLQSSYWGKSAVLSMREETKAAARLYCGLRHWYKMVPLRIKLGRPLQVSVLLSRTCQISNSSEARSQSCVSNASPRSSVQLCWGTSAEGLVLGCPNVGSSVLGNFTLRDLSSSFGEQAVTHD